MKSYLDMINNLDLLVSDMGFTRTANAITNLYNNDQLEHHIAVALKNELAEMYWRAYAWDEADEALERKCDEIRSLDFLLEVEQATDGFGNKYIGDAKYNRYRLENNQMSQWIDNPIHDHPVNQIKIGSSTHRTDMYSHYANWGFTTEFMISVED